MPTLILEEMGFPLPTNEGAEIAEYANEELTPGTTTLRPQRKSQGFSGSYELRGDVPASCQIQGSEGKSRDS